MAAPPRLGDIGAPPNYIETNTEGCQRNMPQMKEQIKTPEKQLNKMEISNLSDAKFKTLAIRMVKELSEDFSSIKKDPVRNEVYPN